MDMSKPHAHGRRAVFVASALAPVRRRYVDQLRGRMPVVEIADHATLIERLMQVRPAVVFLDLALPGLGGIAGVETLRRLSPAMKVVLLTDAPNARDAVVALVAGARGYCARGLEGPLIVKATEVVQQGEVWIGRHVIPYLLRRLVSLSATDAQGPAATPRALDLLAPREREIALLVGAGRNNKEIALALNISEATVKAHLTSVYRKVKVSDRLRLALYVTARRKPASIMRRTPAHVHVAAARRESS